MNVKYTRTFYCDNHIAKGIKWLNQNGFYTIGCCSGLNGDHDVAKRDLLYIEFESLSNVKISQLKIVAKLSGFEIKKRKGIMRFESKTKDKLSVFNDFIKRLKNSEGALNLRTMGISNWVYDSPNKKLYSIQFYDYDLNDGKLTKEVMNEILKIFPLDCIMYETKQGIQFISFALRFGLLYTKSRAVKTSKELLQDYWTEAKDLTLRIAPKWDKNYNEMSFKPKFKGIVRRPDPEGNRISGKHLDFFRDYMGLPNWVYEKYSTCDKRDYKYKIYHYKTRD